MTTVKFVHEITLPKPKNGNEKQTKFVERFNEVSELFKRSQDPELSEEDRNGYSKAFWQSKYCLEQGIY